MKSLFDQHFVVEPALLEEVVSTVICSKKKKKNNQVLRTLKINLSLSFLVSLCSCLVCSAIMLKRIYRSTPPEVIVEVLEPYVHLTTANVRIIKNRTGPMGHTYGFIDLDSHAVSFPHLTVA